MDDMPYPDFTTEGDLLNDKLALNPEHKLVKLNWPVHTTAPNEIAGKQGDYFLFIDREKNSGNIQFMDVSILYAYIIEQLTLGVLLKDILVEANTLFQLNDIALLKDHTLTFIEDLKDKKFVLGFLKNK